MNVEKFLLLFSIYKNYIFNVASSPISNDIDFNTRRLNTFFPVERDDDSLATFSSSASASVAAST